ncbi:MAG TPA: MotA/TolQ/ExbB proton channel family protein [Chthoniobacterales bacterium]|nr:MotA/TolQ/ExbB proton channel family protein [Chthoniobacterales bacterium]
MNCKLATMNWNYFGSSSPGSLISVLTAGGWVMLPLGILSVITLALILVYLVTLRFRAVVTGDYMRTAEALLKKGDLFALLAFSNRRREAIARIMSRTIDFWASNTEASFEHAREVAQTEGVREASLLNQRITWLSDIATISPMLGLLGTVFGMIRSFSIMANDVAATRPMLLAEGVAQALVATAAGLVVGIAAMVAYALFRGRVQAMISDLESATTQLLALFPKGRHSDSPSFGERI